MCSVRSLPRAHRCAAAQLPSQPCLTQPAAVLHGMTTGALAWARASAPSSDVPHSLHKCFCVPRREPFDVSYVSKLALFPGSKRDKAGALEEEALAEMVLYEKAEKSIITIAKWREAGTCLSTAAVETPFAYAMEPKLQAALQVRDRHERAHMKHPSGHVYVRS